MVAKHEPSMKMTNKTCFSCQARFQFWGRFCISIASQASLLVYYASSYYFCWILTSLCYLFLSLICTFKIIHPFTDKLNKFIRLFILLLIS